MTTSKNQKPTSRGTKQSQRTDVKQKYLAMSTWNPKHLRKGRR